MRAEKYFFCNVVESNHILLMNGVLAVGEQKRGTWYFGLYSWTQICCNWRRKKLIIPGHTFLPPTGLGCADNQNLVKCEKMVNSEAHFLPTPASGCCAENQKMVSQRWSVVRGGSNSEEVITCRSILDSRLEPSDIYICISICIFLLVFLAPQDAID